MSNSSLQGSRDSASSDRRPRLAAFLLPLAAGMCVTVQARGGDDLDTRLATALERAGFTGRIESTLEQRLGRRIDRDRAKLGRFLFFDKITGLRNDNACAGCHSPGKGFGDTQSIAIGV